jgi:succinate dehydrogenase / fumarate reductase cytochrome b subunit
MANFWWKMKFSSEPMPLHTVTVMNEMTKAEDSYYVTHDNRYISTHSFEAANGQKPQLAIKNGTEFRDTKYNLMQAEGYKDLHSVVLAFFGHDKSKDGVKETNDLALFGVLFYVLAMVVLGFHLWHGFSAAFQSVGINHKKYNKMIKMAGQGFAIVVPALFAIIPIIIFMNRI